MADPLPSSSRASPPGARGALQVAAVLSLALLGDALIYVVLPLHAAAFGITFVWVGILLSANRMVRIVGYGVIARFGRRIGLRRLTIAAAILATASTAAYGLCEGEIPLLAARIGWGLAFGALNLTTLAYAVRDPARAGQRVGLSNSVSGLGPVLSLSVGAWLVSVVGPQHVFVILAVATAASIVVAWMLPDLPDSGETKPKRLLPWPTWLDLWAFALGFAIDGVFVVTLSVLLSGVVSVESAVLAGGLLLAARRGIEMMAAPAGGTLGDRFGAGRVLLTLGIVLSAGLLASAAGWVILGAAAIVLTRGALGTLAVVLVARLNPGQHMSALSVYATWRDLGAAIGPLVAGFSVNAVGVPILYGALGILLLAMLALRAPALIALRAPPPD
jgi:MFS transporter, DHA1 family, inner membrane transport protein